MTSEINVTLADIPAWDRFVADNREALEEAYGSLGAALKHICDGGLTLGGGAAPLVYVRFAED